MKLDVTHGDWCTFVHFSNEDMIDSFKKNICIHEWLSVKDWLCSVIPLSAVWQINLIYSNLLKILKKESSGEA